MLLALAAQEIPVPPWSLESGVLSGGGGAGLKESMTAQYSTSGSISLGR